MSSDVLEHRLADAFADARSTVGAAPDLFARMQRSLEDARERRRFRWRVAAWVAGVVLANVALAIALSDFDNGRFHMDWWVIELITNIVLVALAVGLGPFIKRFGRSYAADVFRANPRTGKSYLVLTDVAYYLIFTSFVLFTVRFEPHDNWLDSVGKQLMHEVARVGGILLIMGVLHAANVVALPIIGGLLATNRRREDIHPPNADRRPGDVGGTISVPPLGAGTWILRIEPAGAHEVPETARPASSADIEHIQSTGKAEQP